MPSLNALREKSLSLIDALPYQPLKDSPTIKYYTDWKLLDSYHLPIHSAGLTQVVQPLKLPSNVNVLISGKELIYGTINEGVRVTRTRELLEENITTRIDAIHYASLIQAIDIHFAKYDSSIPFRLTIESALGGGIHEGYHVRIFISDGLNVDLELFEIPLSDSSAYNGVVELIVGKKSSVNLTHVVIPNKKSPSVSNLKIVINEGSSVSINSMHMGGLMHRQQINGFLLGNSSRMIANVGLLGNEKRKIDYVFDSVLKGLNNELLFSGLAIAEDNSYVSMRAIGRISKISSNSLVDIRGHTYNIGAEATAIGSPVLEINSNNVRLARHSVSISNISEDILFYLMSRGLSIKDVKNIFRSELISKVISTTNDYVRTDVKEVLGTLLENNSLELT